MTPERRNQLIQAARCIHDCEDCRFENVKCSGNEEICSWWIREGKEFNVPSMVNELLAEIDRLTGENQTLEGEKQAAIRVIAKHKERIAALQAENERLKKGE